MLDVNRRATVLEVKLSQALMTINRADIRQFETGVASLPSIAPEKVEELLQTPSAKGAGYDVIPLACIGLTPLSVFMVLKLCLI